MREVPGVRESTREGEPMDGSNGQAETHVLSHVITPRSVTKTRQLREIVLRGLSQRLSVNETFLAVLVFVTRLGSESTRRLNTM